MSEKIVTIVGAGPGVSLAVARKFGSEGFRVVLVARRQEALAQYTAELESQNIQAYGVAADAGDAEALKRAFDQIKSNYGSTEVLVYNAAVLGQGSPQSLTAERLTSDFQVNVAGALTSTLQVVPDFIQRKRGTILFTGGGLALNPYEAYASLSIGKAGIRSLAFSLAQELGPLGIFVSTVTIAGFVKKDTFYDPDKIAEVYWELHVKKDKQEVVYQQA